MTFYEVTSRYYDNKRKDTFCLKEKEAEQLPKKTHVYLKTVDVYHDYFASREEAENFILDSQRGIIRTDGSRYGEEEKA